LQQTRQLLGQVNIDVLASKVRQALDRWDSFPVGASPRPVVLVGPKLLLPESLATDAEGYSKDAQVDKENRLHKTIMAALANDQLRGFTADLRHPLEILSARPKLAEFATDRGPKELLAWKLDIRNTPEPAYVLHADVALWEPPLRAVAPHLSLDQGLISLGGTVLVSSDGRQLSFCRIGLPGAPPQGRIEVHESASAATVFMVDRAPHGSRSPAAAVGVTYQIRATLSSPLGNRVIVNSDGEACEVQQDRSA
jgi:hypothetical protein